MKKGIFGALRTLRAALLAAACAAAVASLPGCWIPAGGRMNVSSLPDPAAAREPLPPPAVFGGRAADPKPPQARRRPIAPSGGASVAAPAASGAGAATAVSKALDEAEARRAKPGLPTAAEVAERSGAPARSIESVRPQASPRIRTDLGVKPAPAAKPAPSVGAKFRQPGPIPGSLGNPALPPPAGGFILPAPGGRR